MHVQPPFDLAEFIFLYSLEIHVDFTFVSLSHRVCWPRWPGVASPGSLSSSSPSWPSLDCWPTTCTAATDSKVSAQTTNISQEVFVMGHDLSPHLIEIYR